MSDPAPVQSPEPPRRSPRWVKILLALSLSLNLLVLGVVVGAVIGFDRKFGGPEGADLRPLGLGPFALAMDREARDGVRDRIDRRGMRADALVLRAALADMQTALRSDPFDRALAEAALSDARAATGRMQLRGHEALLDQFEGMSLEDRVAAADRVARSMRRIGMDGPRGDGPRD